MIERVSAILRAEGIAPFRARRISRNIIAALQLSKETKLLEDGYSGQNIDVNGTVTAVYKPATRVARYVTPYATDTDDDAVEVSKDVLVDLFTDTVKEYTDMSSQLHGYAGDIADALADAIIHAGYLLVQFVPTGR